MRRHVDISADRITPSVRAVARGLGIPRKSSIDERTRELIRRAIIRLSDLAEPVGIMMEIDRAVFERVYQGDGQNEPRTPLEVIAPKAEGLALYAVTVGAPVCREISRLFEDNDFAEGAALDAAASESAELASEELERQYTSDLARGVTMPFSPGYCGWHVSAQRVLFDVLKPEEIKIELTPSCLMEPLKSVSGVILVGDKDIFAFEDDFPFCDSCTDRTCRARIAALAEL